MELKYHQETYQLLTEKPIDPRDDIERYSKYYDDLIRGYIASSQDVEKVRSDYEEGRRRALGWTRVDLYQRPVRFSEANIQQLDVLEQKYGMKLPASVREWFSLDITPEIMSAPIPEFGYLDIHAFKPFTEMPEIYGTPENREDFWYFLHSEYIDQGGEYIAFKMNAGDDPPVYAENLDEFVELASTFSEFIYQHFWNWHSWYTFKYGFSLADVYLPNLLLPPEFEIPVEHLQKSFKELIGKTQWWFYDEHCRIWPRTRVTWNNKELVVDESRVGGGSFAASNLETLRTLITYIWGNYPPLVRMDTWKFKEETQGLIEQMQQEAILKFIQNAKHWVTIAEIQRKLAVVVLSEPLTSVLNQLQFHIDAGSIESHPYNQEPPTLDNCYRIKKMEL